MFMYVMGLVYIVILQLDDHVTEEYIHHTYVFSRFVSC